MSAEAHADGARPAGPPRALEAVPVPGSPDRGRPNLSGDLPTVFGSGPMFRRAVGGYDRFEVDSYVRWAEDELAAADRERERLLARHLDTQAALDQARRLLPRSAGGGAFLRLSDRIGAMLAAAADQAESMRTEAEAERIAAVTQAERLAARADRALAGARAEAARLVAAAGSEARELTAAAARILEQAARARHDADVEAQCCRAEARAVEQRAAEHAGRIRREAARDAVAARLRARDEIVGVLGSAREERRRADAEAATVREELDRAAAARRSALVSELADLESRRAALDAELVRTTELLAAAGTGRHRGDGRSLRRLREVLGWPGRPAKDRPPTERPAGAPIS